MAKDTHWDRRDAKPASYLSGGMVRTALAVACVYEPNQRARMSARH